METRETAAAKKAPKRRGSPVRPGRKPGSMTAAPSSGAAPGLIGIALTLLAIGILMIYSTSAIRAEHLTRGADSTYFLRRQILWAALSGIAMILAWQTDYRILERWASPILLGTLILLALVLIPGIGTKVKGARRWIRLGGYGFQPSELAKVASIIYMAAYIGRKEGDLRDFRQGFIPGFAVVGIIFVLVALEPDFGTAVFLSLILTTMLFIGGIRILHLVIVAFPGAVAGGYFMWSRFAHVKARFLAFLNPGADPLGKGYQIRQALIALGSGGWFGVGLGESRQKLLFLPDEHTDFILAILGEELGFMGAILVVGLFAGFVLYGLKVAWGTRDRFGFFLSFGIVLAIALQAIMNIAVVTASMPTKGISLPLVSFGGSSLLFSMVGIGILLSIDAMRNKGIGGNKETGGEKAKP